MTATPSWSSASLVGSLLPYGRPPTATDATSRPPSNAWGTGHAWLGSTSATSRRGTISAKAVVQAPSGVIARNVTRTGTPAGASGGTWKTSGREMLPLAGTVIRDDPGSSDHRLSLVAESTSTCTDSDRSDAMTRSPVKRWPEPDHAATSVMAGRRVSVNGGGTEGASPGPGDAPGAGGGHAFVAAANGSSRSRRSV